jgi:hypothetical protein
MRVDEFSRLNLHTSVLKRGMASKTLALEMEKKDDGKLSVAVRECLNEIDRALKRMESDQAEIDRIKAETKAILKKLKAA